MNIFADFHHTSLYESFHLLFEKRLGHQLYRPIGMSWFDSGLWKIADFYPDPRDTAKQYLELASSHAIDKGDYYSCYEDIPYHTPHKAVTYEQFMAMDIDIIISSIPQHWASFERLLKVKPKAKHIAHIGNGGPGWNTCPVPNVMTSVPIPLFSKRDDQQIIYCNQEFSLDVFSPAPPSANKWISAFAHCQPERELWTKYKGALPDYRCFYHGVSTDDGLLPTIQDMANKMHESMWGWCVKPADGYGHVLHNFLACGRPVIVRKAQDYPYRDFLVPGENCIDLDIQSFERNVDAIRNGSLPETYRRMREQTVRIFAEQVDFARDAERVKAWIEHLRGGIE